VGGRRGSDSLGGGLGFADAHCHLAFHLDPARFPGGDPAPVVAEAHAAGVTTFVQGGYDPADWDRQEELKRRFGAEVIWTAYGLHPWWIDQAADAQVREGLAALATRGRMADAIGEIGLDHGPRLSREGRARQEAAFDEQLALARELGKPVILHVVRAHARALTRLRAAGPGLLPGIVHSFSGSADEAWRYLELGLLISAGPGVLGGGFAKAKKALDSLPPEAWVLETDSPDRMHGPAQLREVAEGVARLRARGESADELLARSAGNLRRVFQK
jgi:TatD DNase family protein